MKIIIASDIFGKTPELENFMAELSSDPLKGKIIDPYQGIDMKFKSESYAYEYFQKNFGIKNYKTIVFKKIKQIYNDCLDDLLLIGFSVGASAIWSISDKLSIYGKVKAICFYSSQIRSFIDIDPEIKIELFFPEHEPHFDVTNLISKLSHKKQVKSSKVPYLHGFMNKKSKNFNANGYQYHLQLLKKQII
ncbi:MAG: hypothetical protein GY707_19545 [Desulfobacteraceae bacterium]|nr:hypothetical protein [Desulfobacteraceae bacterium]